MLASANAVCAALHRLHSASELRKDLSPAAFAMRPRWSPMSLSRIARRSVSPLKRADPVSTLQAAAALDICREDCDEALADCHRV